MNGKEIRYEKEAIGCCTIRIRYGVDDWSNITVVVIDYQGASDSRSLINESSSKINDKIVRDL